MGDATDPQEKLLRIRQFCLTEITNVYADRFGLSAEERADREENKKPSDTFKHKQGSSYEIANLYVALLQAAGFEARIARMAGRDDVFFNPAMIDPYFLKRYNVAIKVNGDWQFSDLNRPYLEHGMLDWAEEGTLALIADPKEASFVQTEISGPEKTVIRRQAELVLDEKGNLEGDVTVELTGHAGSILKHANDHKSEEERELDLEETITDRLGEAEISEIEIANVTDLEKPYTYSYHIRVSGYAMATGKRLIVQPAFFQFNKKPRFQTSERKYDVYFRYPWTESDEVTVRLPEGYQLEDPEAPMPIGFGQVGHYKVTLRLLPDRTLVYNREFVFGNEGRVLFPVTAYPLIKQAFDQCHREDTHALMLLRDSD